MNKRNQNDFALSEVLKDKTSDDFEEILKVAPLNSYGYPAKIPVKNRMAKNVLLKFYHTSIKKLDGEVIEDKNVTFDILESDVFDKDDKNADLKIRYLAALFSTNRFVDGAVYYRGEFITHKVSKQFALSLTEYFMQHYFSVEDAPLIETSFDKMDGGFLPYFPSKTKDGKKVIFAAYKATVQDLKNQSVASASYTFNIIQGDTFDLEKKEDLDKIAVIKSLLDSDKLVKGFYYKGKLLPDSLNKDFRLYLEKSFVKKNFVVEQKDFILMNTTKDVKTGYPLFYPMKNRQGKNISISVLNADVQLLGYDKSFSNFDIPGDHSFDLNKEEDRTKLKIVQALFFKKSVLSGALYLDGMLIPSDMKPGEVERRRMKAENACGLYLDDNEDFVRINTLFTIEDRFHLLSLTDFFDPYFPDNVTKVPQKLPLMKKTNILVRFDRVNIITEEGTFLFDNDFSLDVLKGDSYEQHKSSALDIIVHALVSPQVKIRGAIYFKGYNILKNDLMRILFDKEFLEKVVTSSYLSYCKKNPMQRYQYKIDPKTGMLRYWPTVDKSGREVLLSVVDGNVFFGSGKKAVKACQNLNFDVYTGETFGLVGESGSGKTTISRAILGINQLRYGAIYFKGKLISTKLKKSEEKLVKKNIQMIFQDPAASLNERANIDYIVSEGLYNFHLFKSKEERLAKVTDMMESVGLLPEHLSRYPHEFSGGQRQRIGIARALVIEPQLVLADEPISALDVSIRAQVLNLLKKLQNEKNLTYLFIAHDLSIIRYISDRIAVMHHGHIVELGKAEEIYSHPIHPYTRALLTAIPQPDPKTKEERKKLVYENEDLDYEKCSWIEAKPDHYILATEELAEAWKNDDVDSRFLKDYDEFYSERLAFLEGQKKDEE